MIRYLKWIFLIFGGMALLVIGFFGYQNRKDLSLAWDYSDKLDYEYQQKHCKEASKDKYYFPCFKKDFKEYVEKGGLTAIGLGLKMAFNFMDKDKANNQAFETQNERDVAFALNYLELNNMAISQSYLRFNGFKNMYGGYLSSLRDYLDGAKKFSDNLIHGLESDKGIASIKNKETKDRFAKRFASLKSEYERVYSEARGFTENEIEDFLEKAEK